LNSGSMSGQSRSGRSGGMHSVRYDRSHSGSPSGGSVVVVVELASVVVDDSSPGGSWPPATEGAATTNAAAIRDRGCYGYGSHCCPNLARGRSVRPVRYRHRTLGSGESLRPGHIVCHAATGRCPQITGRAGVPGRVGVGARGHRDVGGDPTVGPAPGAGRSLLVGMDGPAARPRLRQPTSVSCAFFGRRGWVRTRWTPWKRAGFGFPHRQCLPLGPAMDTQRGGPARGRLGVFLVTTHATASSGYERPVPASELVFPAMGR
jgi:hypothetical protein